MRNRSVNICAPPHPLRTWRHNSLLAVRIYIPVVAPLAQLSADDIDLCYRKSKGEVEKGAGEEGEKVGR